ncbi:MAG: hypothetical protein ABIQ59_15865 [Nocardioidaceae bacterium]
MSAHSQRRTTLVLVVVTALVVAVVGLSMLRSRSGGSSREEAERTGSHEMMEALEKRPGLAAHRLPLAFVAEKLEQQGGEAGGEILNGPAQEAYDQRAYPRSYIAPGTESDAKASFAQARTRGSSVRGKADLAKAQGNKKVSSWEPLGPDGGLQVPEASYTGTPAIVSGRTTSLATEKTCTPSTCTLYAGTAGGGLWRTKNALATTPTWSPIGADIPSTAIGVVYRAPNGTLFVGTGEPNGSSDSEAGLGLYKSTDGGDSFSKVDTFLSSQDFALNRSIASVSVDPTDPKHLYVGTAVARHGSSSVNGGRYTPPGAAKVGLYESKDAGSTWTLSLSQDSDVVVPASPTGADFFRGGISKILQDPTHADTVYASMFDYGLFRRIGSGTWQQIYTIKTPGSATTSSTSRVEYSLTTLAGGQTRIYLGDATYYKNTTAGLLRSDDGSTLTPTFTELSNPTPGTPGYGSYNFCQGQCSYDMVVTSPSNHADEVMLSGSMNYDELEVFGGPGSSNGRAVVRSVDAGVHVTDMTNDAQASPNGLHPDHHALTFAPTGTGPEVFFSASDGGVVRQTGPFVNRSSDCGSRTSLTPVEKVDCQQYLSAIPTSNASLNKGLQTLQFQSVSVNKNGGVVQGGTQDNGTWESDQSGFAETVGGDGGQSGFNVDNAKIRYHSYYAPQHDVSFDGGSPTGWDFISDPLLASGEASSFYTPLTADPTKGGTVFDGLQHVWRTPDNGGDRPFLDQYCNELTGDYGNRPKACGDWQKLGGAAGDLSGGNRANYVVAVERAQSNDNTMWAATRLGGLFISANANAADPNAVTYQRIDQNLGLPKRFVSGIAIDPANPNHAFVSYSGYSAYSPGGHVYEVTVDSKTGQGTAKDLSANLGDQPVTDVVWVPRTQSLFVSTDFGVLASTRTSPNWVATPGLPRVAVYGLTLDEKGKRLFAATHGRSVWQLRAG